MSRYGGFIVALVAAVSGAAAACSDLGGLTSDDVGDAGDASAAADATIASDSSAIDAETEADAQLDAPKGDGGCTTTPFVLGKAAASLPEGGSGWNDVANVLTADGGFATHQLSPTDVSETLRVTSFPFAVPAQATITGVIVSVVRDENSSAQVVDNDVTIGSTATGPSGSEAKSAAWPTLAPTAVLYGGATEDWGLALTPAIVNAPDFGVSFSARQVANGATSLRVDSITAAVRYCE